MGRFKLIEGGRPEVPRGARVGEPRFREPARSLEDYGEGEDTQIMMPDSIVLDETISRTGDRYVEEQISGRQLLRGDSLDIDADMEADIDADTLFNEVDVSQALSVLEDSSDVIRPAPERDVMASTPPPQRTPAPRMPLAPESEPQVAEWRAGVEAGHYLPEEPPASPASGPVPAPPMPVPGPGMQTGPFPAGTNPGPGAQTGPFPAGTRPGPGVQTGPFPTGTTDPGMQIGPYQVAYGPVPTTGPYATLPGYPPQMVTGSYPQFTMPFAGVAPGPSSTFKTVMIAAAVVVVAAGGVALGWVLFGGRDKPAAAPAPAAQIAPAPATSAAGTAPTSAAGTAPGAAAQTGTTAASPGASAAAAGQVPASAGAAQPGQAQPAAAGTTQPAAGEDSGAAAAQAAAAGATDSAAAAGATDSAAASGATQSEVTSIEHPAHGHISATESGEISHAFLRRSARVKRGERLFVISHKHPDGPKAAQLARRIKELESLARKEPDTYNAFLKRARAQYQSTQRVDHDVVTARATGLARPKVTEGDHVRKGDVVAELVDSSLWLAHATFEQGDPQRSWTCSVIGPGDKRAACQIRAVNAGKHGNRVTAEVSAVDAPWLEGHEHPQQLTLELAPPAEH